MATLGKFGHQNLADDNVYTRVQLNVEIKSEKIQKEHRIWLYSGILQMDSVGGWHHFVSQRQELATQGGHRERRRLPSLRHHCETATTSAGDGNVEDKGKGNCIAIMEHHCQVLF